MSTETGGQQIDRGDFRRGLQDVGLQPGDVVLVHCAMRTFGPVDGGPSTVVESLLEAIGESGTLVVPAFTFAHEVEEDPVIDPRNDPSEMGVVSETVRCRNDSLRSVAYRHSFAAVGGRAAEIAGVNPALSPFDLQSAFGVILAMDAKVLFLGVTYATSTSHHFAEWVCNVPYRRAVGMNVKVRRSDGSIVVQKMTDYQPRPASDGEYYGSRHPDFNRLGRMMEEGGSVRTTSIGNAAIRCFRMRDLVDRAKSEAARNPDVFRTEEGKTDWSDFTQLDFGSIVLSPPMEDGAGRSVQYQWAVMDESQLRLPG